MELQQNVEFIIINLVLLLQVLLDATGDAMRVKRYTEAHHIMEALQVAIWMFVWYFAGPHYLYIIMYVGARFVFFDLVYNLIVGNPWFYFGKDSYYDRIFRKITEKQGPVFTLVFTKGIVLVGWIAWVLSSANGKF